MSVDLNSIRAWNRNWNSTRNHDLISRWIQCIYHLSFHCWLVFSSWMTTSNFGAAHFSYLESVGSVLKDPDQDNRVYRIAVLGLIMFEIKCDPSNSLKCCNYFAIMPKTFCNTFYVWKLCFNSNNAEICLPSQFTKFCIEDSGHGLLLNRWQTKTR